MKKLLIILVIILALPLVAIARGPRYAPNPSGGSTNVSDTAYDAGTWDGVTDTAASKNAIRDKIESLAGGHNSVTLAADADVLLELNTQEIQLDPQSANYVFAGPTSGGSADPTFRLLVADDIPDISAVYQPLDADLTSIAGGITGLVNGLGNGNGFEAADLSDFPTTGSWSPTGTIDLSGGTITYRSILNADISSSAAIDGSKLSITSMDITTTTQNALMVASSGSGTYKYVNTAPAEAISTMTSARGDEDWTDYSSTSTIVGWTGAYTKSIWYCVKNDIVYVEAYIEGESDTDADGLEVSFTLPWEQPNVTYRVPSGCDGNGLDDGSVTGVGSFKWYIGNASNVVHVYKDCEGSTWTQGDGSTNKKIRMQFWYPKGAAP